MATPVMHANDIAMDVNISCNIRHLLSPAGVVNAHVPALILKAQEQGCRILPNCILMGAITNRHNRG